MDLLFPPHTVTSRAHSQPEQISSGLGLFLALTYPLPGTPAAPPPAPVVFLLAHLSRWTLPGSARTSAAGHGRAGSTHVSQLCDTLAGECGQLRAWLRVSVLGKS